MNGQGRQPYPTFPPPPTGEHAPDRNRDKMTTGLPNYAYRAMYDNQEANQYPPPPPAGSHSTSDRSRRSVYGSTRERYGDEHYGTRRLEDGLYESERRNRRSNTNDRRPRRRPTSSYDSSSARSYSSRSDTRHHHRNDDRHHHHPRRRSRSHSHERDKRDTAIQKQQQQKQEEDKKKTGFAKIEEYITPFNVGILMGCMDLIGGTISLYMTNKRFSKKALAKGPAPGEPGASSSSSTGSSGGKKGDADELQDNGRWDGSEDPGSSSSSGSSGSYWSRSDTRGLRYMPEWLEYDSHGRVLSSSGAARAAVRR